MNHRFILAFLIVALVLIFGGLTRWIVKLPSKYSRRPQNLSPWNALDEGLDPSISEIQEL